MPEFGNPFSGMRADRKVTNEELIRAVRFMIAAEYEAVQLYMQLAESTDNQLAKAVLKDIADEEIVHAGEFLTLLKALAPEEAAFYDEGEREVREIMEELAAGASVGEAVPEKVHGATERELPDVDTTPEPPTVGNLFGRDQ